MGKKNKYIEIIAVVSLVLWGLLFLKGLNYENIIKDFYFYPYVLLPFLSLIISIVAVIKSKFWLAYLTTLISFIIVGFVLIIVL
jgi:hypothetical protein